jgi:iduronate 2-sulfatase
VCIDQSMLSISSGQRRSGSVLFLISDDLTAEALACYGNTTCQTPHIDQSEGKEVERFFVMFGHCSAIVGREDTMPR